MTDKFLTKDQQIIFNVVIETLVSRLPQKAIEMLALGPIGDDEGARGCRLCDTMDETIDRNNPIQMALANILLDYHDIDGSEGRNCLSALLSNLSRCWVEREDIKYEKS